MFDSFVYRVFISLLSWAEYLILFSRRYFSSPTDTDAAPYTFSSEPVNYWIDGA